MCYNGSAGNGTPIFEVKKMALRDKNGRTEAEFLASYNADRYPKPSLTADVAVIARDGEQYRLLLIRRGGHPYLGAWALPGGFANAGEAVEETAARELLEETGIEGVPLRLVGVYSKPGRDPRGWVVSAAFCATVRADEVTAAAGDDAADAAWFDVAVNLQNRFFLLKNGEEKIFVPFDGTPAGLPEGAALAFDHADIVSTALKTTLFDMKI